MRYFQNAILHLLLATVVVKEARGEWTIRQLQAYCRVNTNYFEKICVDYRESLLNPRKQFYKFFYKQLNLNEKYYIMFKI